MKLAIMQPYLFPYIGYFSLIKATDRWIVFDTAQFIRHGWIERNRILKPIEGWQYVKVPLLKHSREESIKNVVIDNSIDWRNKIFAQLTHYKKKAKYYEQTINLLEQALSVETLSIVELNCNVLKVICNYLNIPFKYSIFSEMDLSITDVNEPDEWALEIAKALKGETYINPIGGLDFFNREKYEKEGIHIQFLKSNLKDYSQRRMIFEPGLSIIDVLMFNSPDEINEMLNQYELV